MMKFKSNKLLQESRILIIKAQRRLEQALLPQPVPTYQKQESNNLIKAKLLGDEPCMIARYGYTELKVVSTYLASQVKSKFLLEKYFKYFLGRLPVFWWDDSIKSAINDLSGFFPTHDEYLNQFSQLMLECSSDLDILGSWLKDEFYLRDYFKHATTITLSDLEPYRHHNPWSVALEGKNILVIHPFQKTIESQYKKHHLLFEDKRVLPKFNLITIKAHQSIAGQRISFQTWFDALDDMKQQILDIEFDIAIIGAGAYGFPLASFVKQIGKKSVHLGGATQILFGIKGKRWDESKFFRSLYNEYWVRPSAEDIPRQAHIVEGGCYW